MSLPIELNDLLISELGLGEDDEIKFHTIRPTPGVSIDLMRITHKIFDLLYIFNLNTGKTSKGSPEKFVLSEKLHRLIMDSKVRNDNGSYYVNKKDYTVEWDVEMDE